MGYDRERVLGCEVDTEMRKESNSKRGRGVRDGAKPLLGCKGNERKVDGGRTQETRGIEGKVVCKV